MLVDIVLIIFSGYGKVFYDGGSSINFWGRSGDSEGNC